MARDATDAPTHAGPGASREETLRVEVVYAPAGGPVDLTGLTVPAGATLERALVASGVLERHGLDSAQAALGIWGRRARPDTALRQGDRVEVYRPLVCDPKEARRHRHRRQRQPREPARPATSRDAT